MFNQIACPDAIPGFLNFFDFSIAPPLLFYAYIPIILISLFFGFYVFVKDKRSLQSTLLLLLTFSFIFWVINILFQWVAVYANIVYFSGELVAFFEVPIFLLSIYFVQVFLTKRDIAFGAKLFLGAVALVTLALIPTTVNVASFDLVNCQVNVGPLWQYLYGGEIVAIIYILYLCIQGVRKASDKNTREQIVHFALAVFAFLSIFVASNIFGEITKVYSVNLFGPAGMVIFLVVMAYMIVKYQTFNVKLFATQALVIATNLFIGSRLFATSSTSDFFVAVGTFAASSIGGFFVIQSVKREIRLRENLTDTTSIITHQIRGVFTNTKSGLSTIIEGDYGPVPDALKGVVDSMFKSQVEGVKEVETFLQAQKVESGTIQYEKKPFDLKAAVEEKFAQEKSRAETKGLQYEMQIDTGDYMFNGDQVYLTQVVANLIDNAIRYTEKGSIKVQLARKDNSVLYSVKDSGIGIPDEDKDKMFTKYGHGKDSRKTNAASSGLGLYIVHGIVVGHGGKIWYETKIGEGTTFFVELPVA